MSSKKILIIEDDLALGKTLKNVLMLNDYQADIAISGAEGIQKAYEYCPDLILCDINMKPIDGYQVFNILKDSILTSRIPFIFITGRSELNDIRMGLELGVDDYIVKPFKNEDLLKSIQVRLEKYEKLVNIGKNNYKALLNLSPYGVFVFDGETIYETNKAFLEVTGLSDSDVKKMTFEDLLTPKQFKKIEGQILKCVNGLSNNFQEDIKIKTADGNTEKFRLHATPSQKYSGFTLLIGLLSPIENKSESTDSPVEYSKLVNILEEEKITISGDLAHKLHKAFTPSLLKYQQGQSDVLVSRNIFSKREKEVLTLSCKGLPIKMIADQLNISDRTVEKHRANLMEKTGGKNIVEVIIYALKNDLVDI